MPRPALPLLALLLSAVPALAQEPIRFARTPDISPDGKLVAFSYLGDLWTVEAIGGVARPVTMHEAHDYCPVFSPDGRHLAFASNRHGSYDVFVVPTVGGKPTRLTFDSAADIPVGWTADGQRVIFTSTRSTDYPNTVSNSEPEIYTVAMDGGAEKRVLGFWEAKDVQFAPAGDRAAFVRGPGSWYRRGYRGSSNDDIYLANADGSDAKRLTAFDGQDAAPMWSPDGKKLYYVTENGSPFKCANVVVQGVLDKTGVGGPKPLTKHTEDSVRRARISRNGEWIVYECGGDLWVTGTGSGSNAAPRKLAIEVHADDKSNTEKAMTFTRDASGYALSPDEKAAVVVCHGQLFVTKLPDGGKGTRLTEHSGTDHSPCWSPDGKRVVFVSDRTGAEELFAIESDDAEHPELAKAHKFKTTQLTKTAAGESGPSFQPKTDRIGFLKAGQLWTMKADGTDAKVLVADKKVIDYEWSPDGKWVAYGRLDGSFASELYIVAADGKGFPHNVSRYATFNSEVTWGAGKLAFVSQRQGVFGAYVLPLARPATDGTKPDPDEIDFDDIHLRAERPAAMSVDGEAAISPDGAQVAFRSLSGGLDLWVASSDGKSLNRLTTGGQAPHDLRWSKKGNGTVYFLNGSGELRFVRTGPLASGGEPGKVPFACKLSVKREEEFAEMFAQAWRNLADGFYDDRFNGADWQAVRARYAPLVQHCACREDLYTMILLMVGELNSSHLGISGKLPAPDELTADLGVLFDPTFPGPGLKVAEVVKHGPADKKGIDLKAGDVVTHIDRTELTAAVNLSKLLNNRANEAVGLTVRTTATEKGGWWWAAPREKTVTRTVDVTAITREKAGELMYARWVARNAAAVAAQSDGKLAYIHIPSMDEAGLETFVRALYSDAFDKEAVVLDVRFNGGGFTHDRVLNYLTGRDHTRFEQRDGGIGFVARNTDRKWSRPLTLLVNNRSFSDAEVFPHAFRASGLGKIVGQATGGQVIFTNAVSLVDGSTLRMPRIGVFRNQTVNMDKEGVTPDVPVDVTADDWAKGTDPQLAKAVQVLTTDVKAWKASRAAPATTAGSAPPTIPHAETKPGPPPTTPITPAAAPSGGEPPAFIGRVR